MGKLCGFMVRGRGMSEARPCMRKSHSGGQHRPDLKGLQFGFLTVVSPGRFYRSSGKKYFTWVVKHRTSGNETTVLAHDLIAGGTGKSSASGGGSGITSHKKSPPPEYRTIVCHCSAIHNPRHPQYKNYKGMPFFAEWDSKQGGSTLNGYFWIIQNLGAKPGSGWSLDIIVHSKGFVPGNLRWIPPGSSIQANNQVHRTIFDVSDGVFAVEAKRRGYKKL